MSLKINKKLILNSSSGDFSFSIRHVEKFYLIKSTLSEIGTDNILDNINYHLIAKLKNKDVYEFDDVIIKYNCSYQYILDFIFTLEDYAFN